MEPVEINAGAWYLRALRDDERVSDVPALAETGLLGTASGSPAQFVVDAASWWADESRFTWAVCEPTTGELIALIAVTTDDRRPDHARLTSAHRADHTEALAVGSAAVTRFVEGALGLTVDPSAEL
ncbi:hypothetical protein [Williamsia maris]|uniref:Uncharacterized protein n=1 Tax=Williamsia maris TaxID=72806 RepID=A0ABT1HBF8_9NOCA|nr:hypothetical protein [Williamsia maris]MCP2174300.1 hypothetical protein [Williamsia maris]